MIRGSEYEIKNLGGGAGLVKSGSWEKNGHERKLMKKNKSVNRIE